MVLKNYIDSLQMDNPHLQIVNEAACDIVISLKSPEDADFSGSDGSHSIAPGKSQDIATKHATMNLSVTSDGTTKLKSWKGIIPTKVKVPIVIKTHPLNEFKFKVWFGGNVIPEGFEAVTLENEVFEPTETKSNTIKYIIYAIVILVIITLLYFLFYNRTK